MIVTCHTFLSLTRELCPGAAQYFYTFPAYYHRGKHIDNRFLRQGPKVFDGLIINAGNYNQKAAIISIPSSTGIAATKTRANQNHAGLSLTPIARSYAVRWDVIIEAEFDVGLYTK